MDWRVLNHSLMDFHSLIAVMLARLQMDVNSCIIAYLKLSKKAFTPRRHRINLLGRAADAWRTKERFESEKLKAQIIEQLQRLPTPLPAESLFVDESLPCLW